MNESTKKKFIITSMIVLIIIILCIVSILILQKSKTENSYGKTEGEEGYITDADKGNVQYQVENVKDLTDFYSVEDVLKEYKDQSFEAEDMRFLQGDRIMTYIVLGNNNICYIVRVDVYNLAYEIKEIKESDIDKISIKEDETEILNNGNNNFKYKQISIEETVKMYYEEINRLELEETEQMYNKLNEQYKKIRFPTYNDYKVYVEEMKEVIQNSVISKYSVEEKDGYREYTLVDNFNNTYIVRAKGVKNYSVLLDNYTIKVDNYSENYSKLSNEEKVRSNVYIFIQMINTKDDTNAYNLLADSFKNNYFKDQKSFEEYMKNNWFSYNLQTNIDIKSEGINYICNVTLRDGAGSASNETNKTIIMQLKDNTDFIMSFTV